MDQRRIHPKALQSSMEYDQYLRARLADGVGESEASIAPSMKHSQDYNSGERSSVTRPTVASMSRMRNKSYHSKEVEAASEQPAFEPLRHSWRRHIEPPQSTGLTFESPSRGEGVRENIPTSPAQIASLLKVAQDSMSESKRRSEMISRLLAEEEEGMAAIEFDDVELPSSSLSPRRRKKMGPKLTIEINSPQRSAESKRFEYYTGVEGLESNESSDSISFSSGKEKARIIVLKRTFRKIADNALRSKQHRERREEASEVVWRRQALWLKERYMNAWKVRQRELVVTKKIQNRRLGSRFQHWWRRKLSQDASVDTAKRHFKSLSAKRALRLMSGLVQNKREKLYQHQLEAIKTDHAANFRDKHLLAEAFRGIRRASALDRAQKEIEEESAGRRARIANLMSNLRKKLHRSDIDTGKKSDRTTKTFARSRSGSHATQAEEWESKLKAAASTDASISRSRHDGAGDALHAEAKASEIHPRGRRERHVKRCSGDDRHGYNEEGKWDDGFASEGKEEVNVKRRADIDMIDILGNERERYGERDDSDAPPPAYSSGSQGSTNRIRAAVSKPLPASQKKVAAVPRNRSTPRESAVTDPGALPGASRSERLNSSEARMKNQHDTDREGNKDKVSVAPSLTQAQLDQRAHQRRLRISELRHASQQRVFSSKREREEALARKRELADLEYAQEQEEYRTKVDANRVSTAKKAQREAEMKEKAARAMKQRSRSLLVSQGFGPWRRLVQHRRIEWVKAMDFYEDTLLQSAWIALYGYCMNLRTERARREMRQTSMSAAHYKRALIVSMFKKWKLHRKLLIAKARAVTGHFSRFTVHRRAFGAWRVALERERRRTIQALRSVKPRGDRVVKRHFWSKWMQVHQEALLDREVASRAESQWVKVQSWLN